VDILTYLKNSFLIFDGGMGTLLQERGLKAGEYPENWNIEHPEIIRDIHRAYFDAGSNVVSANTFGANCLKFGEDELEAVIREAIKLAKQAQGESERPGAKFVALDIGPTGRLLKPYGDFGFEDAVETFAKTIRLGEKYGADVIIIETMNDSYETKAALLAAKENSALPVFVLNAYGEDGKLMTGASPEAMVAMLEGMRADAIGVNCSLGPKQLRGVVERILDCASVPVVFQPNAGLPKIENGKTVYDVLPDEFSEEVAALMQAGVRVVGGCCGTTPEYIKALCEKSAGLEIKPITDKGITCVSSYTHAVRFGQEPILIGERINPTGKKRLKQALKNNDIDYILGEGFSQQDKGIHILDVNVGLPEIDEIAVLKTVISSLQAVINLPLQIDTASPKAMEEALRLYNGKALINSVCGKQESMDAVFPIAAKYGGVIVALTLDDSGIPETAEGRFKIAERILVQASKYGISKKDIIFDTLAMTISADTCAALGTLDALRKIRGELGCHTSLGVSNVSFGLPARDAVNSTFFALALESGLSAAIMNPFSDDMLKVYYSYRALHNLDPNCSRYIEFMENLQETVVAEQPKERAGAQEGGATALQRAVIKGLKESAGELCEQMLSENADGLDIINNELIPALDIVGRGFEEKTVYLPQLLMSAEAAQSAFGRIKARSSAGNVGEFKKCGFVLATVHGDIHDIGKNIVKLILENYGFAVTDLGKDVPPEDIVSEATRLHAPLVGLSALMTTTVPAMEETIRLLREKAPWCKVVVGGAVLNKQYAEMIGADKYASDAMETVRYAEKVNETLTL